MNTFRQKCDLDLGIPYDPPLTPSQRLQRVEDYVHQHGLNNAGFNTAKAADLLEMKVADLFGVEAAIWFPTGTMAQGVAAKIHVESHHDGSKKILLHPTSHLLLHEEDGYKHVYNLQPKIAGTWTQPLDDSSIDKDLACVFIEMPQRHSGGVLPSWQALESIKQTCAKQNVPLHMDGARLWACRPFYENRSYAQILKGFDSVYVSFYKDIGASGGAMLLGNKPFIEQAGIWRTRLGGFSPGSWPMIVDTLSVLEQKLKGMPAYVQKAQSLITSISDLQVDILPADAHVNLFHLKLSYSKETIERALQVVADTEGVWLSDRIWEWQHLTYCSMEFVIGENALRLSESRFRKAVECLLRQLADHSG